MFIYFFVMTHYASVTDGHYCTCIKTNWTLYMK